MGEVAAELSVESFVDAERADSPALLSGVRLWLARLVWLATAALSLTTFWAALPARSNLLLAISWLNRSYLAELGLKPPFLQQYVQTLDILIYHLFVILALIIFMAKPAHRMAIFASAMIFTTGSALTRPPDSLVSVPSPLHPWFSLAIASGFSLVLLFLYLYPEGTIRPRSMRLPAVLSSLLPLAFFLTPFLRNETIRWPPRLIPGWLTVPLILLALAALYLRFRATSERNQRLRIRWLLAGSLLMASGYIGFLVVAPLLFPAVSVSGFTRVFYILIGVPFLYLSVLALPLSITIAIIRHGLWDIDSILNRTVVYISMTGILAGIYTVSVKLMQEFMVQTTGTESDIAVVLTTVLIVAVFTPLKNWLQGFVDKRFRSVASPHEPLRQFDKQVESVLDILDPMRITYRLINTAGEALGASSGTVYLLREGERELVHSYGDWQGEPVIEVPLQHQEKQLGWLAFGPPASGESYSDDQRHIVRACAERVAEALAIHARLK